MKNLIFLAAMSLLVFAAHAQNMNETLSEAFNRFEGSDSLQTKMNALNRLELIASKWSDQWTTQYYAAYGKIVISYLLTDEKQRDGVLDQAESYLAKAKTLSDAMNDELYVMDAYVANARLAVKSGSRWKKYGSIFDENLEKAKAINPDNPRIYFLKGQSLYYTPKAFGGGEKKALPLLEKAASLFSAESSPLINKPHWGRRANAYYLEMCRKKAL